MILTNTTARDISLGGDSNKRVKFVSRVTVPANGSFSVSAADILPLVLFDRGFQNEVAAGRITLGFGAETGVDKQFLSGVHLFMNYETNWSIVGISPADYMYVSGVTFLGLSYMLVVNVNDPGGPTIAGQLVIPAAGVGTPWSTMARREQDGSLRAYVTTWGAGGSGLYIFDVSNPSNIQLLGYVIISASTRKVRVKGNYAYVVDGTNLYIFNISNPAAPAILSTTATAGVPWSLDVVGNYAYVLNGWGGEEIYNISNPAAPVLMSATAFTVDGYEITVSGNYAYIADGTGGFRVLDVSNPAAPAAVFQAPPVLSTFSVYRNGNYVYTGGVGRIDKYDVTIPTTPVLVGYYNRTCVDLIAIDDIVYGSDNFYIATLDTLNSASFQLLGANFLGTFPLIFVLGQFAMLGKEPN